MPSAGCADSCSVVFFDKRGAAGESMPRRTRAQPLYEPRFDVFLAGPAQCASIRSLLKKTHRIAGGTEAAFTRESLESGMYLCDEVQLPTRCQFRSENTAAESREFQHRARKNTGRLQLFSLSKKVLTNRKTGCKRLVVCRPFQFLILRTGFSAAKIIPPYPYTPPGTIGSSRRKLWLSRALRGFFDSLRGACLQIQSG